MKKPTHIALALLILLLLSGCLGSDSSSDSSTEQTDDRYGLLDDGIKFYAKNMDSSSYRLDSLSDEEFNSLDAQTKQIVADKLLSTLFFGMSQAKLQPLIDSNNFISTITSKLKVYSNDMANIEHQLDDNGDENSTFYFSSWPNGTAQTAKILARFYMMDKLDRSYLEHWSSYVLAQNIMFSPAQELASSHAPNIERVYSFLVRSQRNELSLQYLTYLHMFSDDNWRRFRSPEDNGREMMEIFLLNFDDKLVPLAAKALQNWSLDRDHDTLVIGVNDNSDELEIFGTTVTDGFDFYRELVKDDDFISGVSRRLVEVYFPTFTESNKRAIVTDLVASNPSSWQDILLQIVFSEAYLLDSDKPKSVEELFFSLAKKMHFKHKRGFFSRFSRALVAMHQASMKYKLGRYTEVPLDTQSFITYHKFIREELLISDKNRWSSGWVAEDFISDNLFDNISAYEHSKMLDRLVEHLFAHTVSRKPLEQEYRLFRSHMLTSDNKYRSAFEIFNNSDDPLDDRIRASKVVLDYISRLTQTYRFVEVK